jgi:hypothetical protein
VLLWAIWQNVGKVDANPQRKNTASVLPTVEMVMHVMAWYRSRIRTICRLLLGDVGGDHSRGPTSRSVCRRNYDIPLPYPATAEPFHESTLTIASLKGPLTTFPIPRPICRLLLGDVGGDHSRGPTSRSVCRRNYDIFSHRIWMTENIIVASADGSTRRTS